MCVCVCVCVYTCGTVHSECTRVCTCVLSDDLDLNASSLIFPKSLGVKKQRKPYSQMWVCRNKMY